MTRIVAVSGGIGSGKSVVSRIIAAMGYEVYDCDSRAKALMDADARIKRRIADEIDAACIVGDAIDRRRLSSCVFSDHLKLERLNAIVHAAVRDDIAVRVARGHCPGNLLFVETAILYQSGLDLMASKVIEVTAPVEIRVGRVMKRNSMSRAEVMARIESQDSFSPGRSHADVTVIVNDGVHAVLPRVEAFISSVS